MSNLATIITVREATIEGDVIARFVHSDDARTFAAAATEREPGRVLFVADRRGDVNERFEDGFEKWA